MYNQYLVIKYGKNGNGIFTNVKIPASVPIFEVTGTVYVENKLPDPNDAALIQVGPNTFIGPSGGIDDYINHSCDPNCMMHVVGNRAICYSLYTIPAGAELTYDYSTTATDSLEKWKMDCHCGSNKCRKVISGFQYLNADLQETYKNKNMIPLYITHSIIQPR
jgi:hypothetical protein